MADFKLRPGPYQPDLLSSKPAIQGNSEEPTDLYEGPHGPLEVYALDNLHTTVVKGPGLTPVRLAWGPHVKDERDWVDRLRNGITCEVDGVPVSFHRGRLGLTRSGRVLHCTAGDRSYVYRLRRVVTYMVERGGGQPLVRFNRRRDGGWMDDGADRLDVVVVVLLMGSGLLLESPTLL